MEAARQVYEGTAERRVQYEELRVLFPLRVDQLATEFGEGTSQRQLPL